MTITCVGVVMADLMVIADLRRAELSMQRNVTCSTFPTFPMYATELVIYFINNKYFIKYM